VKEANPSFSVGEISRELGRRWAEATPESKLKYVFTINLLLLIESAKASF